MQVIFFSGGVRRKPQIKDKNKIGTGVLVETGKAFRVGDYFVKSLY